MNTTMDNSTYGEKPYKEASYTDDDLERLTNPWAWVGPWGNPTAWTICVYCCVSLFLWGFFYCMGWMDNQFNVCCTLLLFFLPSLLFFSIFSLHLPLSHTVPFPSPCKLTTYLPAHPPRPGSPPPSTPLLERCLQSQPQELHASRPLRPRTPCAYARYGFSELAARRLAVDGAG
jgi:hypothetical protein